MINFNVPIYLEKSIDYIVDTSKTKRKISGDGIYTKMISRWLQEKCDIKKYC